MNLYYTFTPLWIEIPQNINDACSLLASVASLIHLYIFGDAENRSCATLESRRINSLCLVMWALLREH